MGKNWSCRDIVMTFLESFNHCWCQVKWREICHGFPFQLETKKTRASADRCFSGIDCDQMKRNFENPPNGFLQNGPIYLPTRRFPHKLRDCVRFLWISGHVFSSCAQGNVFCFLSLIFVFYLKRAEDQSKGPGGSIGEARGE